MEFATDISGVAFTFVCDAALRPQAEWLEDMLKGVAQERGDDFFRDGFKIQVGWSILTIKKRGAKYVLYEPDFSRDPFQHIRDDITCTLSVQAEQNDFVLAINSDAVATSFQDKILYLATCLNEKRVYLERKIQKPGDSGWYIGLDSDEATSGHFKACCAFELLRLRPALMKVLQLPVGYLVVFDGNEVEAVLTPENKQVWGNDFVSG